jgi:hypothetical protein
MLQDVGTHDDVEARRLKLVTLDVRKDLRIHRLIASKLRLGDVDTNDMGIGSELYVQYGAAAGIENSDGFVGSELIMPSKLVDPRLQLFPRLCQACSRTASELRRPQSRQLRGKEDN